MRQNSQAHFRNLLAEYGCSEHTADALWAWYDYIEKKGAVSF